MKSLSVALSAALGAPVQTPALLVEFAFDPVKRWSSFADLTWNGHSWTKEDVAIDDLQAGALRLSGTLRLGNGDGAAAALVLAQPAQDRAVRLWGYDAAATASGDVVWLATTVLTVQLKAETIHFDGAKPGEAPPGWTATQTGRGNARWAVVVENSAPSKPNVLKQSGEAAYPICLQVEDGTFADAGKVGVWTKADSVTLFDDFSYDE